jgi:tetratricopeptide (TPR) repeat protein
MTVFPLKLILDNANYPLVLDWNFHVFFSILSMFIYGWVVFFVGATFMTPKKTESPTQGAINRAPTTGEHTGSPLHPSCLELVERSPVTHHASRITHHAIAFFLVFFVITLAPVLQIIPLHEIVALHYLYVPVIGFCAVVGIMVDLTQTSPQTPLLKERGLKLPLPLGKGSGERLNPSTITPFHGRFVNRPYTRHASLVTLLLLLSFFSIRTITRNFELKDIWTAIHADEKWMPLSFRGYFTIGAQYVEMKFPDKAGEYYQKALETGSWDGNLLGNIIGYHILKGDHAAAINFYEEMLKKNEFITPTGTLNMAVLYMLNGNCEKAVQLATSFSPLSNQVKRIELIKKCDTYGFDKFDDTEIEDIYHKQELMKSLGLEVERKPYLMQLVGSVNRGEVNSEEMKDKSIPRASTHPPTPSLVPKEGGQFQPLFSGKRGVVLSEVEGLGELESPFTIHETLDLIRELAVVNLQSDIPEAIKYYKLERELLIKLGKPVPDIVERSIAVLEDYQYKVLVEGKYYKLEW